MEATHSSVLEGIADLVHCKHSLWQRLLSVPQVTACTHLVLGGRHCLLIVFRRLLQNSLISVLGGRHCLLSVPQVTALTHLVLGGRHCLLSVPQVTAKLTYLSAGTEVLFAQCSTGYCKTHLPQCWEGGIVCLVFHRVLQRLTCCWEGGIANIGRR